MRTAPSTLTHVTAWERATDDFSDHLARQGHPSVQTCADYCRRVLTYGRELPCPPWELMTAVLSADLDGRNWSAATRKATLVALRRFYAWAVLAGRVERSPLIGVPDGAPNRPGPLKHRPADLWNDPVRDFLTTLRAAGRRPGTVNMRRAHLTMLSHLLASPCMDT